MTEGYSERLERATRAVAEASGYTYFGESLVLAARKNPRAYQFVSIAKAVMKALDSTPGSPDGPQIDSQDGNGVVVAGSMRMKHTPSD